MNKLNTVKKSCTSRLVAFFLAFFRAFLRLVLSLITFEKNSLTVRCLFCCTYGPLYRLTVIL